MEKDIFVNACSAAGSTLRKLHNLDADELKNHTKLDELGNLQRLLKLIINMYPDLEDIFNKELNGLTKNAGADHPAKVYAHRDYFDKQILYSHNRTTLLDYDNAAAADPALDVGNFLAHMSLRSLQHPHCSANIRNGSRAFMDAYGNFEEGFLSRAAWWSRAARLRLAALYSLRPRWRDLAYKLLNQPVDILDSKAPGGINEE
jgi:thiamine kinase-like enzyme